MHDWKKKTQALDFTANSYKKAYLHLFNEITDTIEHLKEVQQQTEEIIIAMDENETE